MPWQAIVFAIISLAFTAAAWWRAGRAAKLAEDANNRAVIAESRAEEAHTILKERFASDKERAQAQMDAPGIAEIWAAQVRQGRQNRTADGGNLFAIYVDVPTLAHRMAVELLRARSNELHISRIGPSGGSPEDNWTILGYTAKAIIRLRLDQ